MEHSTPIRPTPTLLRTLSRASVLAAAALAVAAGGTALRDTTERKVDEQTVEWRTLGGDLAHTRFGKGLAGVVYDRDLVSGERAAAGGELHCARIACRSWLRNASVFVALAIDGHDARRAIERVERHSESGFGQAIAGHDGLGLHACRAEGGQEEP